MVAVLVRLHALTPSGVVLILGCQTWQKELVCREVRRHSGGGEGPSQDTIAPVDISSEVGVRL